MFVGEARSLSYSGAPERSLTLVGSGLTRKHWTRLERLARDKNSSLWKSVNYDRKKFYSTGLWSYNCWQGKVQHPVRGSTRVGSSLACFIVQALGWKWLTTKNTLAYWGEELISTVKNHDTGPGSFSPHRSVIRHSSSKVGRIRRPVIDRPSTVLTDSVAGRNFDRSSRSGLLAFQQRM